MGEIEGITAEAPGAGAIGGAQEALRLWRRRYRGEVIRKCKAEQDIKAQLAALEAELRGEGVAAEVILSAEPWQAEAQGMACGLSLMI